MEQLQLISIAERGDNAGLRRELSAGAPVDARDPRTGWTPLIAAAASSQADEETLRLLLAAGADVNAHSWTPETAPEEAAALTIPEAQQYTWNGTTALLQAASTADLARVRVLLDAGADITAATTHGYDALINAIYSPHRTRPLSPLVALLLEQGADPRRKTAYGESALQAAAGFGSFDVVWLLLDAGAERSWLGWTLLMEAIVFGSLDAVRAALLAGANLEERDSAGRTALQLAVQVGDLAKARALRAAGAALATSVDGRSPLTFAVQPSRPELLAWLLEEGCDPNAANSSGQTPLMEAAQVSAIDAVRLLVAAGARVDVADQFEHTPLALAEDVEIVRLLLGAGADLNLVNDAMRKALFGFPAEAPLELPRERYLATKGRRFGQANPEIMAEPFWHAMIRGRAAAYSARTTYDDTTSYGEPVWCFQRFGRTLTALPDGRYVEVGGEHEDYYDADFCIYNDVVVYHGGGAFTLYGYPLELFPPTDFHTATLVGDTIYLIGSLGYQGQRRVDTTPVYRLNCVTWAIERVQTSGRLPGWISRHAARYDPAAHQIIVQGGKRIVADDAGAEAYIDNSETFSLDLSSLEWR